jgi:hypothetical protein
MTKRNSCELNNRFAASLSGRRTFLLRRTVLRRIPRHHSKLPHRETETTNKPRITTESPTASPAKPGRIMTRREELQLARDANGAVYAW